MARLLGLGYPGGKTKPELARTGDRDAMVFPRGTGPDRAATRIPSALRARTAVARCGKAPRDFRPADVAAGFQESVADV